MVRWLTANLTVSLPEDEHDRIKKHPEIKWRAVARNAMTDFLNEYEKFLESQPKQSFEIDKYKRQ